jgi:hypothetical protein
LVSTATLNYKFNPDWSVKAVARFYKAEQEFEGAIFGTSINPDGSLNGLDNPRSLQSSNLFYHEKDPDIF